MMDVTAQIPVMSTVDWIRMIVTLVIPGILALTGSYWGVRIAISTLQVKLDTVNEKVKDINEKVKDVDEEVEKVEDTVSDHEIRITIVERNCGINRSLAEDSG